VREVFVMFDRVMFCLFCGEECYWVFADEGHAYYCDACSARFHFKWGRKELHWVVDAAVFRTPPNIGKIADLSMGGEFLSRVEEALRANEEMRRPPRCTCHEGRCLLHDPIAVAV
jgi:hypothetical protein